MPSFSPGQEAARRLLEGPQRYTCLAGGTRSGKTFLIIRAILARASKAPDSRHAILRFHANAARASIALDTLPNVARLCFPKLKLRHARQDGFFELPNKSRIWVGGLDDKERVEKILGLEYVSIFLNEASQIPYASALVAFTRLAQKIEGLKQRAYVDLNPVAKSHWTNLLFGEKRDPVSMQKLKDPRIMRGLFSIPSTTPKTSRRNFSKALRICRSASVSVFMKASISTKSKRRCGPMKSSRRRVASPPTFLGTGPRRVVVALDPSGAAGRDDLGADEIGLVVAARGTDGDCYILADWSCREAPAVGGGRAVTAFHEFRADCIVAECNFGGEMVRATIQAADPNVPVRLVTASRGKAVRAEPISVRYAQRQVHHAGRLPNSKISSAPLRPQDMAAPAVPITPTRRSGR